MSQSAALPSRPTKRSDPKPRQNSGIGAWTRLDNRDPTRWYVWVFKADQHQGPDYYLAVGYEVETQRPNGPKPIGGRLTRKDGETIEWRGHVLMSCSLARKAEIEAYGEDGEEDHPETWTGQRHADSLERDVMTRRGTNLFGGIGVRTRGGDVGIYHKPSQGHNVHVPGDDDGE